MPNPHNEVVIHIDKKEYRSPDPTTGAALYVLGGINPETYDLYHEVPGQGDDVHILNDATEVDLKNGVHFYSVQKNINPGC